MTLNGVSDDLLAKLRKDFEGDPKNLLAQNACIKTNVLDVMRMRSSEITPHVFSHKVKGELKPVTNQRSSGRCWIFACLNAMRIPFAEKQELDDFEFSQSYLFFWDKVERCNYNLQGFIRAAKAGEPADGRLVQHLLLNPAEDGGQWHMLVNLIEKYGLMPKKTFPCSWTSENSRVANGIINNKMREYCCVLRGHVKNNMADTDLQNKVNKMVEEIYRVVSICIGTPPTEFVWEYYDKNKKYQKIGPISPLEFYRQYVKPIFNMEDKIVLVNDPRPEHPYDELYTVDYLGNMTGGRDVLYINQAPEVLKKLAATSIKENEPVWFGCDVGQHCSWRKHGVEDVNMYNYELVMGISVRGLSKSDRLLYRDSLMTHAMTLTAVTEEDGETKKWRIENSWGDDGGEKGYMAMTDEWFTEYVFEIVVDKKYVPDQIMEVLEKKPIVLPAWDPMGALASQNCCDEFENSIPRDNAAPNLTAEINGSKL